MGPQGESTPDPGPGGARDTGGGAAPDALADLVAEARAQVDDLPGLDPVRVEAWASGLLGLLDEIAAEPARALEPDHRPELEALLARLEGPDPASRLACRTVRLVAGHTGVGPPSSGVDWEPAVATARIVDVVGIRRRDELTVGLRCVDATGDGHLVLVDLEAGRAGDGPSGAGGETVGEVVVAPGDLLGVLDEDDAGVELVDAGDAGVDRTRRRLAGALARTHEPRDGLVMNARLLCARLGPVVRGLVLPRRPGEVVPPPPARDPDDDAYAAGVLARAVGVFADPDPVALAAAARRVRTASSGAGDPGAELVAVWRAAGPPGGGHDLDEVTAVVVAAVAPVTLEPLAAPERDAVCTLEWADWLGAVVEMVRRGPGAPVDGESLVDAVNRCPEVTTSIPRRDRARIAWAFDVVTAPWAPVGLVDDAGLTDLGVAVVPRALVRAWTGRA